MRQGLGARDSGAMERGLSAIAQPLLEREDDVARLEGAVESAASGAGRLLLLEGHAGLGKSRLMAEAQRLADDADVRVLAARPHELERDSAWGVALELFEPVVARASTAERSRWLHGAASLALPVLAPHNGARW